MANLIAGAKPWQIVVIALGTLGAIGGLVYFASQQDNGLGLKHEVTFGDVATGELFVASTGNRGAIIPEINPETKSATLVRVQQEPDGRWVIVPNDRSAVPEGVEQKAVEGTHLKVVGQPKRMTLGN